MNPALKRLEKGLRPFAAGPAQARLLADPAGIVRAGQLVVRDHGGAGIQADTRSIMAAINHFRATGKVENLRDLKYVCLGLCAVDEQGNSVVGDAGLRDILKGLVNGITEPRLRIRNFQALLSSYWSFPLNGKQTTPRAKAGWAMLREWLLAEYERLCRSREPKPIWFAALSKHRQLLSEQLCDHFGPALMRGDASGLRDAVESLAIPVGSWVQEEAVIAQMRAGCALIDQSFKSTLDSLIDIGSGRGGVELGVSLRVRCMALLVSRYARCSERPEHAALRDTAVAVIGNPSVHRPQWDAWVVDAQGQPDRQSREMLAGWLKRELIKNFFALLSADGAGDSRRLDYWLNFEPFIDRMWFGLGTNALYDQRQAYVDFKSRATGHLLKLTETKPSNNAFVMRVGRYLLVEFGETGNAMFVFAWDALAQPLRETLESGRLQAEVSIYALKGRDNVNRLIHHHSETPSWEQTFDAYLGPLTGRLPNPVPQRPTVLPARMDGFSDSNWKFFVTINNLRVVDNRGKQGALWVLGANQPDNVVTQLRAWKFKPRAPRGWYKE